MAAYTAPIRNNLRMSPEGKNRDEPIHSTGWAIPGAVTDNEPAQGTKVWTNDNNASTIANTSNDTLIGLNDSLTEVQPLHFHDFGLNIPAAATIVGVTCMIYLVSASGYGDITIDKWYLTWDDGVGGWTTSTTNKGGVASNTSDGEQTAGGAADLWGEGSIAVSDVNDAEFGFYITPSSVQVSPAFENFTIQYGGIKVDYTDTPDGRIEVAQQYVEVVRSAAQAAAPAPNFARVIVVT